METFHLFHLAACWTGRSHDTGAANPPMATSSVSPSVAQANPAAVPQADALLQLKSTTIRAAGVHMVFASRKSRDFITPEQVNEVEAWAGQVNVSAFPFSTLLLPPLSLSRARFSDVSDKIWHGSLLSVRSVDPLFAS
jgi:uridine phosphorylase